jgi:multidrug efflux pump subunit AcrB
VPRRVFIAAAVALLVIGGGYAARALPFVWLAPHPGTRLQVLWQDPGTSVPRIAETVARPLARALGDLDAVDDLSVTVSSGRVEIALSFNSRARDPLGAVRKLLARTALPPDGEPVRVFEQIEAPEMVLVLSTHDLGMPTLSRWTTDALLPALRGLAPVAALAVEGAREEQIIAIPDQRRLAGVGLAPEDVIQTLREALRSAPEAAYQKSGQTASLSAVSLRLPSGEVTALGEFTRFATRQARATEVFYDGAEALRIAVRGKPAVSERALREAVTSQIGWLRANGQMPDGLNVAPVEELRITAVQARRSLQRAMVIGALAALAFFFALTGSARALWGRVILLFGAWGAVLVVLWMTTTPLSVPTLGGMALAIGPLLALSYARRVLPRRDTATALATGALFGIAGIMIALVPWLFAAGMAADHYRGLLLAFALVLGAGILIDAMWAGRRRKRRAAAGGWRSRSAAWLVARFEQWRRAVATGPWSARALLLVLMASALLAMTALHYRDVPLDAYRPLVFEWVAASSGAHALANEDARLKRLLAGEPAVRHRELTYLDPSRTLDGQALVRARFGVEPGNYDPAWRERLLGQLSRAGLNGLRLFADPDAVDAGGLKVLVHASDWRELLKLGRRVAERARAISGVVRIDGAVDQVEHYVLRTDGPRVSDFMAPQSQIDRALALAEGEIVLGEWQRPSGRTQLRLRLDPRPEPAGRVLIAGESRGVPARYLRDLGELTREPVPRWLRLDEDGYVAPLEVIPAPYTDTRRLATELTRALDGIGLAPRQYVAVLGRDDIAAALGPAWRVALLAGLSVALVMVWSGWRGSTVRSGLFSALVAVGVTLVTAAATGAAGVAPSPPYLVGLILVFGLAVTQGGLLGGDPGGARRPFGRRVLDTILVTLIMLVGILPLTVLPGAAGALLAPLAQVVSSGLLVGLAVNLLFLPAFFVPGPRRRAR